ncbi:MAG: hypothetical protein Q4D82_02935 [Neisseria sp.]|nr:hypothetical protein [Neisseria sp.]
METLEKLETAVNQLAQNYQTLLADHRVLLEENSRLQAEQQRKDAQHQAAVDELSEALLVQVGKLKEDLQDKITALTAENEHYRKALAAVTAEMAEWKAAAAGKPQEGGNE